MQSAGGSEQFSFAEKLESSSSAQVAFAVAIPGTKYNGGSFGGGCSLSK